MEEDVVDLTLADSDDEEEEEDNSSTSSNAETHIVFAIDFSGSMKKQDVQSQNENGKTIKISRWSAVFTCMDDFLTEQIQEQQQEDNDAAMVSVLIFNETAHTLLDRMPLVGDGAKVRKALQSAQKMHRPNGGTSFSAGFERAQKLVDSGNNTSNVALIFLSDGRPGDLRVQPPERADMPMQSTFRRHKQEFPAASHYIEQMKEKRKGNGNSDSNSNSSNSSGRLDLHFVCLYHEGKKVRATPGL